jgi:toxin-antitoxin system PIN domain toxin
MRALLDVNVLVALLDADHVDHQRSRAWFDREASRGWASCAITQNGFVRVLSQPGYPNGLRAAKAIELLEHATATPSHEFWPCDRSLLDATLVDRSRVHGPGQLTDVYLLALAVSRGGRFVTLDRKISPTAVIGGSTEHLVALA